MWSCSLIIRVIVVLRSTVVDSGAWRFDNLSESHYQSQLRMGQFSRYVIQLQILETYI